MEGLDIIFLLDSDETGRKYSQRLRSEGHKVLFLDDRYKDPWEYFEAKENLKFVDL
jgi:hypothetical protein